MIQKKEEVGQFPEVPEVPIVPDKVPPVKVNVKDLLKAQDRCD